MRVLLINQFYPPDFAATGQLLADLANELAHRHHDVHVICSRSLYNGGKIVEPKSQTAKNKCDQKYPHYLKNKANLTIHRVAGTAFGHHHLAGQLLDHISFYISATLKAARLSPVDVCVTLTSPPFISLLGTAFKKLHKSQLIIWSMDLYPQIAAALGLIRSNGLLHRMLVRLSNISYRQASYVIAIGQVMSDRLIQTGLQPHKLVTIHNWAPSECVKPSHPGQSSLRIEYGIGEKIAIMYSGNLGLSHELNTIVNALHHVRCKNNIRVIFSGNGKSKRLLQTSVEKYQLDFVTFLPPVPLQKLSDHLAAADIHIVSQSPGTEGLTVPSKLYAILAAGRPILFIGPSKSEAAMIVKTSNCGFIIKPGDIHGTAKALEILVSDTNLRHAMGYSACAFYQTNFGRDRSIAKITELVETCEFQQHESRRKQTPLYNSYCAPQAS